MTDPRRGSESDVDRDEAVASSRAVGGVPQEDAGDANSTTGTTPNQEFVGRASGDDGGYEGESGAEARGQASQMPPG